MKKGVVLYNNEVFLNNIKITESLRENRVGLLKTKSIEKNEGMLIRNCNGIHTFFMNFPITVIFLDKKEKVVRIDKIVEPFKIIPWVKNAKSVLELSVRKDISNFRVGDTLNIKEGDLCWVT